MAAEAQATIDTLATMAEVTGGLVAILLAVATFGVALRAETEKDTWSLLPLVARRYGMFLIIGFGVGAVAANGIPPAMHPFVDPSISRWMLHFNVITLPAILASSLWLVCKIIQDAGTSTFSNTLPVMRAAMHDSLLSDEHADRMAAAFEAQLSAHQLSYNGVAWHKGMFGTASQRIEIPLDRVGVAKDVDLHCLTRLAALVRGLGRDVVGELTVRPGDTVSDTAMLIIRHDERGSTVPEGAAEDEGSTTRPALRMSDAEHTRILYVWRRLFIIQRTSEQ